MSPWLITTTASAWAVEATIHDVVGVLWRPSVAAIALATAGLGCLLVFQFRSRRHRSTS